ncbi:MAG: CAP domain-containing protein [Alcaligenaceae bacterium]|nr:MAG: CAP domain-containing protein [Alcaligenaceae bacterium]
MTHHRRAVVGVIFITGLIILSICLMFTFSDQDVNSNQSLNDNSPKTPATDQEIVSLVNIERGKNNAEPLIVSNELQASAQFKADDMANRNYLSHNDPVTNAENGLDKAIEVTNGNCAYVSENIRWGSDDMATAKAAIDGWMGSPSHREAMLDPKYSYTGIGLSQNKSGEHIIVQHFCEVAL